MKQYAFKASCTMILLVLLALLVGCDFLDGLPGLGRVQEMEEDLPFYDPDDTDPPEPVMTPGVAYLPDMGVMRLTWTPPGDPDYAGVSITWEPAQSGPQQPVIAGGRNLSSFTLEGFNPSMDYTFSIRALDYNQNPSDPASVSYAYDTQAPGQVSNVTSVAYADHIDLDWDNPTDADLAFVRVTWLLQDGMDLVGTTDISTPNSAYSIQSLSGGTQYSIFLVAVDSSGNESSAVECNVSTALGVGVKISLADPADLPVMLESISPIVVRPAPLTVTASFGASIDSYTWKLDDTGIGNSSSLSLDTSSIELGTHWLGLTIKSGGMNHDGFFRFTVVADIGSAMREGLVGEWLFSDAGYGAMDSSGNGHYAITVTASPAPDRYRRPANAYAFNGANSVEMPADSYSNLGQDATFSLWCNFAENNAAAMYPMLGKFYSGDYRWTFMESGGNSLQFYYAVPGIGGESATVAWTPVIGRWHHIVMVKRGNVYRFFVDGVQIGDPQEPVQPLPNFSAPMDIGYHDYFGGFRGSLDDVRLFSRALSPQEVMLLFHESGDVNGRLARWSLAGPLVEVPAGDLAASPATDWPYKVSLSRYFIAQTEVTQAAYQAVMGSNPSEFRTAADWPLRPVESVRWFDAIEFCNRLSIRESFEPVYSYLDPTYGDLGRDTSLWPDGWRTGTGEYIMDYRNVYNGYYLPSEAQWEYAARGGPAQETFVCAGSNTLPLVAWYSENALNTTHPVGSLTPNSLGLYDMSGNVAEWCTDWFADLPAYPSTDYRCATYPGTGGMKVRRGGHFYSTPIFYASGLSRRIDSDVPVVHGMYYGFRIAKGGE